MISLRIRGEVSILADRVKGRKIPQGGLRRWSFLRQTRIFDFISLRLSSESMLHASRENKKRIQDHLQSIRRLRFVIHIMVNSKS